MIALAAVLVVVFVGLALITGGGPQNNACAATAANADAAGAHDAIGGTPATSS